MNNSGTDINQLLDQKNKLTSEESSIVDSIVNDLNSKGGEKTSQEKLPQISDEEKEMLMRQRAQQEQQNRHQQAAYQQKMMQQQQMQEQIHKQQLQQQQEMMDFMDKNKDESMVDTVKKYLLSSIDVLVVFALTILFSTDNFSDFLKFKSVPFFYDIQSEKSKFPAIALKALILAFIFAVIKYFIK